MKKPFKFFARQDGAIIWEGNITTKAPKGAELFRLKNYEYHLSLYKRYLREQKKYLEEQKIFRDSLRSEYLDMTVDVMLREPEKYQLDNYYTEAFLAAGPNFGDIERLLLNQKLLDDSKRIKIINYLKYQLKFIGNLERLINKEPLCQTRDFLAFYIKTRPAVAEVGWLLEYNEWARTPEMLDYYILERKR